MAEDSLWLQASLHVPETFGGRDVDMEVEKRLGGGVIGGSGGSSTTTTLSATSSQQGPSQPATGNVASSKGGTSATLLTTGAKPSRAAAMRASLSMDRPLMSASVVGAGSVGGSSPAPSSFLGSLRSIGDIAAQVNDEREVANLRTQLRDANDELGTLRAMLASERQTTDSWKTRLNESTTARYDAEMREREAAKQLAVTKAQLNGQKEEFDSKLAEAERSWQAQTDSMVAKALLQAKKEHEVAAAQLRGQIADLEEQLRCTERRSNDSAMQLNMKADDIRRLKGDLELAQQELQLTTTRLRAQMDQADTSHREAMSKLCEEHSAVVLKMQTDAHAELQRVTEECEERLRNHRQRTESQLSAQRLEVSQLTEELNAMRTASAAMKVEFEKNLASATVALKARAEHEKAASLDAMEREHRATTDRLISEHCSEIAQLKARLSQNHQLEDRIKRLTSDLAAARDAESAHLDTLATTRAQLSDAQDQLARRAKTIDELTAKFEQLTKSREQSSSRHEAAIRQERERNAASLAEHSSRIEQISSERDEEEREWTELTAELKARIDSLTLDMETAHAAWAKERIAMVAAEAEVRHRSIRFEQEAEELRDMNRQLQARIDQLEISVATDSGARLSMNSTVETLRRKLAAAQQRTTDLEIEVETLRAAATAAAVKVPSVAPRQLPMATPRPSPAPQPPLPVAAVLDAERENSPVITSKKINSRRRASSDAPTLPTNSRGVAPGSRKTARDESHDGEPALPPPSTRTALADRTAPPLAKPLGAPSKLPELPLAPTLTAAAQRVFVVSGFEGNKEMPARITSLANATVAQCRPNAPVGPEVTHLISSGALTIKVLSAAARGCWVLPQSYIEDSVSAGRWLDERDYGFQHRTPLLKGRRVAMTEAFKSLRHCSAATLVAKDAGADVNPLSVEPSEAAAMARAHQLDFLFCSPSEVATASTLCGESCRVFAWDTFVKFLYPTAPSTAPSASVAH